jgi:uncharacterized protein (DUF58 family)
LVLARPERFTGPAGEAVGVGIGQSIEFMDFRDYEPGDDLRRIDWAAFARSDRLIIRRFREDIRPVVEVFVDGSRSMDPDDATKGDAAVAFASALMNAARSAGSTATLLSAGAEHARDVPSPDRWPGFGEMSGAPPQTSRAARAATSGAIRVLISDLLFRVTPDQFIRRFARNARRAIVVHLLARDDIAAPACGTLRLRDLETGGTLALELDDDAVREFERRVRAFLDSSRAACARAGVHYVPVIAEEVFDGECRVDALVRAGVLCPR